MARGRRRSRDANPQAGNRTARVGELIRRIVAEEIDALDDDRLSMVSITGVEVVRSEYMKQLRSATAVKASWGVFDARATRADDSDEVA